MYPMYPMDPNSINEGSNGHIVHWKEGIVRKKIKRQHDSGLDIKTQKEIHKIAEVILQSMTILKSPRLHNDRNYPTYYLMEDVDTEEPIWLGDPETHEQHNKEFILLLTDELQRFWQSMWNYGYAAWDFELYLQPPDLWPDAKEAKATVMILDFDKFGKRLLTNPSNKASVIMPFKNSDWFFNNICFPRGFADEFSHTIMDHFNPSRISYM